MTVVGRIDCAKKELGAVGLPSLGLVPPKGKDGEESPPHRWMVPPAKGRSVGQCGGTPSAASPQNQAKEKNRGDSNETFDHGYGNGWYQRRSDSLYNGVTTRGVDSTINFTISIQNLDSSRVSQMTGSRYGSVDFVPNQSSKGRSLSISVENSFEFAFSEEALPSRDG